MELIVEKVKLSTRHMQHGSASSGCSVLMLIKLRCFKRLEIVSSLSPVQTSPMRSPSANNSWKQMT